MNAEEQKELIKILKEENERLKEEIEKLKDSSKRLNDRIASLLTSRAMGRRGMPWN